MTSSVSVKCRLDDDMEEEEEAAIPLSLFCSGWMTISVEMRKNKFV